MLLAAPSGASALSIADYEISDTVTGGDCYLIGSWDNIGKSCTLNTDLTTAGTAVIQVSSNSVTLDGGFHTLTGGGTGSDIGVYLNGVSGVTVQNLNLESFGYGIYADSANNNTISGNTGTGNQLNGLYLGSSNNNEISSNFLVSNASNGVRADNSTGNTFTGNTVNSNGGYGIHVNWGDGTIFLGNETSGNSLDGIRVENSDNCQFNLNTASGNVSGFYLTSSDSATISGNNLLTNGTGIGIDSSLNNSIYNNNFFSNTIQASVSGGSGNAFTLSAPVGGNYWDDFDTPGEGCTDANSNGFCDAAYVFTVGQDSLPWTATSGWLDTTPPDVSNVNPSGNISSDSTTVGADYSDSDSGIDTASVGVTLDGTPLSGCTVGASSVSCPVSGLSLGAHSIGGTVSDLAGNPANIAGGFTVVDATDPVVGFTGPSGYVTSANTTVTGTYNDPSPSSGINTSSVSLTLNGSPAPATCTASAGTISCPLTGMSDQHYDAVISISDNSGNTGTANGSFDVDAHAPTVSSVLPAGNVISVSGISAGYSDSGSGIDTASVSLTLDGTPLGGCTVTQSSISCPAPAIGVGLHIIGGSVADVAGNTSPISESFTLDLVRDYYFTWYDDFFASNWLLMANPAGASGDRFFETVIGGQKKDLSPFTATRGSVPCSSCTEGQVPAGYSLTPNFPGPENMNGPVKVTSLTGGSAVVSERTVWPKGGYSLEEVLGIESSRLSSHYYWTWYDQHSDGYTNWILVANPSDSGTVRVEIKIAGQLMINSIDPARPDYQQPYFDIGPGENVTPTFPGQMGGPVEVKAYRGPSSPGGNDQGIWPADAEDVIASQRVLSGHGTAFNEAVGVPAEELSGHYVWSWFDAADAGARDWVLVANPADAATSVYYEIRIGGVEACSDGDCLPAGQQGPIVPGSYVAPEFPGLRGGPVEVLTFSDAFHQNEAASIASQRIIWGPSFGETMGYPFDSLSSDYHWTWYDQQSQGMKNWVLVANPNAYAVDYQVSIGGVPMGGAGAGTLQPAGSTNGSGNATDIITPSFAGKMGGPVEVTATRKSDGLPAVVIASQRVLYNGFFNEVVGTVLS